MSVIIQVNISVEEAYCEINNHEYNRDRCSTTAAEMCLRLLEHVTDVCIGRQAPRHGLLMLEVVRKARVLGTLTHLITKLLVEGVWLDSERPLVPVERCLFAFTSKPWELNSKV
jgi:hypothetical protein